MISSPNVSPIYGGGVRVVVIEEEDIRIGLRDCSGYVSRVFPMCCWEFEEERFAKGVVCLMCHQCF